MGIRQLLDFPGKHAPAEIGDEASCKQLPHHARGARIGRGQQDLAQLHQTPFVLEPNVAAGSRCLDEEYPCQLRIGGEELEAGTQPGGDPRIPLAFPRYRMRDGGGKPLGPLLVGG